jgi:hypothetical protein
MSSTLNKLYKQINSLIKQKAFAWAKNYELMDELHEVYINQIEQNNQVLVCSDELPIHLVKELEDATDILKKKVECPICMETIQKGNLKITGCGHKYCGECFAHIDKCAICRKKINKKD